MPKKTQNLLKQGIRVDTVVKFPLGIRDSIFGQIFQKIGIIFDLPKPCMLKTDAKK